MGRVQDDVSALLGGPEARHHSFTLLEWGLRVRWVFLAVLALTGTAYAIWIDAPPLVYILWAGFLGALVVGNLLHGRLIQRDREFADELDRFPVWITVLCTLDLLLITAVVHGTGGPHSPVGWLYAAPIMLMSLIGGWRAGIPVAVASWGLYAGLLVAQAAGWIPHLHPERIAIGVHPGAGEVPSIVTPLLAQTAIMGLAVGVCGWFHGERQRYERHLEDLASRDPLTDLPNRRILQVALERAIARAAEGHPSVLMFLDVDNLKIVNDSLGHAAGDQVLLSVVERLRRVLRDNDLLARLAGDEFVVLLEGIDVAQATAIAQRLRDAAGEVPVVIRDQPVYITVSIGLVPIAGSQTAEMVLSWADAAMYEAKLQGRNQVVVPAAAEEEWARRHEHWAWVQRFKHAVDENRLLFHYQPIVRLSDGRIAGYEALLRLEDERGRIIMPRDFLPIAEQAGRMKEIDLWVIDHALKVLRENPGVKLTVNLSAQAFNDEELVNSFVERLRRLGFPEPRLGVEITETMVIRDLDAAREAIERLRSTVKPICLDDFGSGFSSFAYLRHLTVHVIKIDGSLIRDLKDNPRHQAMVQAIKVLADGFQLETVAEFVEDAETAHLLRRMGITYGQGYHFARPAPHFVRVTAADAARGSA